MVLPFNNSDVSKDSISQARMDLERESSSSSTTAKGQKPIDALVNGIFQKHQKKLVDEIPMPERASSLLKGSSQKKIKTLLSEAQTLGPKSEKKIRILIKAVRSYDKEAPFSKRVYFSLFLELVSPLMAQGKLHEAEEILRRLISDAETGPREYRYDFLTKQIIDLKLDLAACITGQTNGNIWEAKDILTGCIDLPHTKKPQFYRELLSIYEALDLRKEILDTFAKELEKRNLSSKARIYLKEVTQQVDPQLKLPSSAASSSLQGTCTLDNCLQKIEQSPSLEEKEMLAREGIELAKSLNQNSSLAELYFELSKSLFNQKRHEEALNELQYCAFFLSDSSNAQLKSGLHFLKSKLFVVLNKPYEESEKEIGIASECTLIPSRQAELNLLLLESQILHEKDTAFQKMKISQVFSKLEWVKDAMRNLQENKSFAQQPIDYTSLKRAEPPEMQEPRILKKSKIS